MPPRRTPTLKAKPLATECVTTHAAGEVIAQFTGALDANQGLWTIRQGSVKLVVLGGDADQRVPVELLTLSESDNFGYEALLEIALPYRVVAVDTVEVNYWLIAAVRRKFLHNEALRRRFLNEATQRKHLAQWLCHSDLGLLDLQLSSEQIQTIMPHIQQIPLPAKTMVHLAQRIPAGCCWGFTQELPAEMGLLPGRGWLHPTATPREWQTRRPTLLYCLPHTVWSTLADAIPQLSAQGLMPKSA